MKKQKHEKTTDLPRSRAGKYEETEGATGAVERPAIPPVMKKGEKPSPEKNMQKGDAGGEGN